MGRYSTVQCSLPSSILSGGPNNSLLPMCTPVEVVPYPIANTLGPVLETGQHYTLSNALTNSFIITPRKAIGNSERKGFSKAQNMKGKYEAKPEFPEEWEGCNQKLCMGGIGYFLEQHNNPPFQDNKKWTRSFDANMVYLTIIISVQISGTK